MLTYRQVLILSYILSMKEGVLLATLAQTLEVSDKTVKNEVAAINQLLPKEEQIQYIGKKGYFIEKAGRTIDKIMDESFQENHEEYVDRDRTNRILMILLFEKDYISMEALGRKLFLSKSMLNKLMDVSWRLRNYIEVSPTKGLRLPWSESKKRNFLAKSFIISPATLALVQQDSEALSAMDTLYQILQKAVLAHHYTVAGDAFTAFHRYMSVTMIRTQQGFLLEEEVAKVPLSNLMMEVNQQIQSELQVILSEKDLWSCQKKLNELNVLHSIKKDGFTEYMEVLKDNLDLFSKEIKKDFNITIEMSESLRENFLLHMYKLKIRNDNGTDVPNFNKRTINEHYPFSAQVIRDYFLPIFKLDIRESEVSYIILYFAKFLEPSMPKQELLLISDSAPSLIYDAQRKLMQRLEGCSVTIIPQYKYLAAMEEYNARFLAILTTEVPVIVKNHRALLIDKFLVQEDYGLIELYLQGCLHSNEKIRLEENYQRFVSEDDVIKGAYKSVTELFPEEQLGGFKRYDLVLEKNIGYFASFSKGKSQIRIKKLQTPILYKDHFLEAVIVAEYNPETNNLAGFFQVIHPLLQTST
ncbi:PRD domain-containing protein [Candidatus Enterococcus murrayae]|uniref:HTH domain-containing protein n=1 Tax=Candidatus Enterococcus murrayae TaxID=2815321 RepID=A0ABS3HFT1_9ENTE|nr:HTH domain-containing protein [Enterococcus sp. MJM16]